MNWPETGQCNVQFDRMFLPSTPTGPCSMTVIGLPVVLSFRPGTDLHLDEDRCGTWICWADRQTLVSTGPFRQRPRLPSWMTREGVGSVIRNTEAPHLYRERLRAEIGWVLFHGSL